MRTDLRSPKLTKAIRHAIREARLAYEFVPNSYTASAFNAVLAVEQGCCGNEIIFSDGPMAQLHRECETPYRRVLDEATAQRASPLTTLEPRSAGCRAIREKSDDLSSFGREADH